MLKPTFEADPFYMKSDIEEILAEQLHDGDIDHEEYLGQLALLDEEIDDE